MDKISILFAKLAALQKSFNKLEWSTNFRVGGPAIENLLQQYSKFTKELVEDVSELYSDLPIVSIPEPSGHVPIMGRQGVKVRFYDKIEIVPIIQNLDYILEVRAGYRIGEKLEDKVRPKRIFLSHGTSKEWYKVQSYIEKDINLLTLELAQQANLGRTVLQKLNDESERCGYAVIIMTGDDKVDDTVRARENVLHEIGFFQGKYGLQNIILLHEEGVNIPSNIHGLVYIPFPKDTVEATFGALNRELKMIL